MIRLSTKSILKLQFYESFFWTLHDYLCKLLVLLDADTASGALLLTSSREGQYHNYNVTCRWSSLTQLSLAAGISLLRWINLMCLCRFTWGANLSVLLELFLIYKNSKIFHCQMSRLAIHFKGDFGESGCFIINKK